MFKRNKYILQNLFKYICDRKLVTMQVKHSFMDYTSTVLLSTNNESINSNEWLPWSAESRQIINFWNSKNKHDFNRYVVSTAR